MISQIIKQLQSDNWYNVSKEVEIAKGRYKLEERFRPILRQLIRAFKGYKLYKVWQRNI